MKLAIVGLGRMGANMAIRLMKHGHEVVGYNRSREITEQYVQEEGIIPAFSLEGIIEKLEVPRIVWMMLPAGQVTEDNFNKFLGLLSPGDILIDGANSNYRDTIRRSKIATEKQIHFLDTGVSGGVWGLKEGYSLMVGGEKKIAEYLNPIFESLAPAADKGWGWVGTHGAGHFVKMVHNGIEYGMMEAFAEGFEILQARKDLGLDLHQISQIWRYGSVIRSWLLDLIGDALKEDPELSDLKGWVADSGEGRWTVQESLDLGIPAPVITEAVFRRFFSQNPDAYSAKLLAATRNQFGGHTVKKAESEG